MVGKLVVTNDKTVDHDYPSNCAYWLLVNNKWNHIQLTTGYQMTQFSLSMINKTLIIYFTITSHRISIKYEP